MNSVMSIERDTDQKLWIQNFRIELLEIIRCHRIHVMYINTITNLESLNAEIAPLVSNNDMITNVSPLGRSIKVLIQIPIIAESRLPNDPGQIQIVESFVMCGKTS